MSKLQIRCWMLVIRALISIMAKLVVDDLMLSWSMGELYADLSKELNVLR